MTGIELQPSLLSKFERHQKRDYEIVGATQIHQHWKFVAPDIVALNATTKVLL